MQNGDKGLASTLPIRSRTFRPNKSHPAALKQLRAHCRAAAQYAAIYIPPVAISISTEQFAIKYRLYGIHPASEPTMHREPPIPNADASHRRWRYHQACTFIALFAPLQRMQTASLARNDSICNNAHLARRRPRHTTLEISHNYTPPVSIV